jgi:putative transposase
MKELTSESARIEFADLESFVRSRAQALIQSVLEQEVDELLGRAKGERRDVDSDAPAGYRNGYGEERRLSLMNGTVTVRRPRVRGTEDRFVSRVLPLFQRKSAEVGRALPDLYLHGLASGDFELAMRGLLGDGAPLSSSSILRMKGVWQAEYESWRQRSMKEAEVVYMWVDGIYVKAGLERDKAALLVVVGAVKDGSKRVLAVESGQRESRESWAAVLRDLKARGMNCPKLVVGDGALGIWSALAGVFPEAGEQRCWLHRMRNVLDCVGKKRQGEAKALLTNVMHAETLNQANQAKAVFQKWARSVQHDKAADRLDGDWERMTAYYALPKEHWPHLRTTNIVESPFASVRLRTAASKRFRKVDGATAMIWKLLMVAETTFRRLRAPELMAKVAAGTTYKDGVEIPAQDDPKQAPQEYKKAA